MSEPERGQPYWVYVLFSDSAGLFYIGVTEDVEARLGTHNSGKSRWTSRHTPWRCVFSKQFPSLTDARQFENRLKRQKGGEGFFRLTGLQRSDAGGPAQGS